MDKADKVMGFHQLSGSDGRGVRRKPESGVYRGRDFGRCRIDEKTAKAE